MGRRRRRSKKSRAKIAKRKAELDKKIEGMSAYEYEKYIKKTPVWGSNSGATREEEERRAGILDAKKAAEDKARGSGITKDNLVESITQAVQGQMGGQPGQTTEGGQSPKGQTQQGGSPKGQPGSPKGQQDPYQTGAPRGSYMDRIRRQRAQQGMGGYGQYGPQMSGGMPPPYNPPGAWGRPNPYANQQRGPMMPTRTRRTYNPQTGLME